MIGVPNTSGRPSDTRHTPSDGPLRVNLEKRSLPLHWEGGWLPYPSYLRVYLLYWNFALGGWLVLPSPCKCTRVYWGRWGYPILPTCVARTCCTERHSSKGHWLRWESETGHVNLTVMSTAQAQVSARKLAKLRFNIKRRHSNKCAVVYNDHNIVC